MTPDSWERVTIQSVTLPTDTWQRERHPRDRFTYVDVSAVDRTSYSVIAPQDLSGQDAPSRARQLVRSGDVIYATVRPTLRRIALIGETLNDAVASTAFCVLRPNPSVIAPRFLYYTMLADDLNMAIALHASGASYPAVLDRHIFEQSISLPPVPTQNRIAAVLALVQRAIATEERWLAAARELKSALMTHVFSKGLQGSAQKESELGPIPVDWEVVPLGSFGQIGNGSTPLKSNVAYWSGGTIPWLTSAKVYDVTITHADQFVTPRAVKECHLPVVKRGSVLIAITGQGKTLGHVAVTDIDTCVSQHIAYLRFEDEATANPHFIRLFVESRYEQLRAIAQGGGSTKGALTCGFLKMFLVPLPSRAEQDDIASKMMLLESASSCHERRLSSLSGLFRTLLDKLLTGEVRTETLDIDTSEVPNA